MNKRQLIDDIRQYNTTAAPQFLAQFDESALQQYLSHLASARKKHVTVGGGVRPRVNVGVKAAGGTMSPAVTSPAAA